MLTQKLAKIWLLFYLHAWRMGFELGSMMRPTNHLPLNVSEIETVQRFKGCESAVEIVAKERRMPVTGFKLATFR